MNNRIELDDKVECLFLKAVNLNLAEGNPEDLVETEEIWKKGEVVKSDRDTFTVRIIEDQKVVFKAYMRGTPEVRKVH